MDSGPVPAGRPGMTASLLHRLVLGERGHVARAVQHADNDDASASGR